MTRKIIGIIICFAAAITQTNAQGLSIELDGGLQGTQYRLQGGSDKLLPGGSLSLLHMFPVGGQWSLLTGITGGVYRTEARLPDGTVLTDYQVDDEGSAFQYNIKTTGYKETQQFFAAGIPLLLQYHTAGAGTQWYIDGGGKVMFPTSVSSNISARQLSLSGYYPDYNVVVTNLPQHGFGTLNNWKAHASAELRPAAALSVATGFSFRLSRGTRLYAGLFAEYGLTDLKARRDSMPLVTYNPTSVSGLTANGVLNMQNAGRMTSLVLGLQVRLSFETTRSSPKVRPKPKPIPQDSARAPVVAMPPATAMPPAKQDTATQDTATVTQDTATATQDTARATQDMATAATAARVNISYEEADFIQQPLVFGIILKVEVPFVLKRHLDSVASIMMQHPTIRISIVGHFCSGGTETDQTEDPKIGIARAEAVARYLKSKGIRQGRMNIGAAKESDPFLPNDFNANYQKRRVVISVK